LWGYWIRVEGAQMQQVVADFFGQVGGASLRLPSGWFGRPHDNQHELTSIEVDGETLVIFLEDHQVLRLTDPRVIEVEGRSLRIASFAAATWEWTEYGSGQRHREEFNSGTIDFLA
jgi:hypothetical protein